MNILVLRLVLALKLILIIIIINKTNIWPYSSQARQLFIRSHFLKVASGEQAIPQLFLTKPSIVIWAKWSFSIC
ncbi:hypothetical protein PAE9249_00160 [Paenibacillus sp. CECT 9249]|nr:hypothetical protein PAE9249_00160 [Paenibacillus sp. CECT 9249]